MLDSGKSGSSSTSGGRVLKLGVKMDAVLHRPHWQAAEGCGVRCDAWHQTLISCGSLMSE
jgi:hypothetical protein